MNKEIILQLADVLFENNEITRNALTFIAYSKNFYEKIVPLLSNTEALTEKTLLSAINQILTPNKDNVYSKNEFCSIMNEIKKLQDFDDQINSIYRTMNNTLKCYEFDFHHSNISMPTDFTLKVLCKMFNDNDDKFYGFESEIGYFVFERDWGRDTKLGDVYYDLKDENGISYKVNIDFSSLENLYDYLIFKMNGFEF